MIVKDDYIAVSGGFDPAHIGHIRLLYDAAAFGKVIIILNSDEWLKKKKGYIFMPWGERREMLLHYRFVHGVVSALDGDGTVCESLKQMSSIIRYFGNGGDRFASNTPELDICRAFGITPIFGLGGPKIQSSTHLVKNVQTS